MSPPGALDGYDSLGLPVITFQLDESSLSFGSPLCTLQGVVIQFGFLAAVFWWVIIAFNMCLEVSRKLLASTMTQLTCFFFCVCVYLPSPLLLSSIWDST